MQLVLSLFSGVGLLDKAFREAGFCVVSAGDLITGQDIRDFTGVKNKFNGVIGGSPCQDFSTLKRNRGNYSLEMINEFMRVVLSVTIPGQTNVTLQQNNNVTAQDIKRCACGCSRQVVGRKKTYDSTCRKRLQRKKSKSGGVNKI